MSALTVVYGPFEALEDAFAARVIGDIDLLVAGAELPAAIAALRAGTNRGMPQGTRRGSRLSQSREARRPQALIRDGCLGVMQKQARRAQQAGSLPQPGKMNWCR